MIMPQVIDYSDDRTPTSQTAIPTERFAIAPQTAIAHNPLILNELLAAVLRYRYLRF